MLCLLSAIRQATLYSVCPPEKGYKTEKVTRRRRQFVYNIRVEAAVLYSGVSTALLVYQGLQALLNIFRCEGATTCYITEEVRGFVRIGCSYESCRQWSALEMLFR